MLLGYRPETYRPTVGWLPYENMIETARTSDTKSTTKNSITGLALSRGVSPVNCLCATENRFPLFGKCLYSLNMVLGM
jgi:hypothetical protein